MNKSAFVLFFITISTFCFSQKMQDFYKEDLIGNVKNVKKTEFVIKSDGKQKIKTVEPNSKSTNSSLIKHGLMEFNSSFPIIEKEFDSLGNICFVKEYNAKGLLKRNHTFIYSAEGILIRKVIFNNKGDSIGKISYPPDNYGLFVREFIKRDTFYVSLPEEKMKFFPDSIEEILKKDSVNLDVSFISPTHKNRKYNYKIVKNRTFENSTLSEFKDDGELVSEYIFSKNKNKVQSMIFVKPYRFRKEDDVFIPEDLPYDKDRKMSYTQINDNSGNWVEIIFSDDRKPREMFKREITYY